MAGTESVVQSDISICSCHQDNEKFTADWRSEVSIKLDKLSAQNAVILQMLKSIVPPYNHNQESTQHTSSTVPTEYNDDTSPPSKKGNIASVSSRLLVATQSSSSSSFLKSEKTQRENVDEPPDQNVAPPQDDGLVLKTHNIYIEMAAAFSNGKFETTFTAIRKTKITPSHVLCFYFTSIIDAKFILDNGFISCTQQCDGIPLSMNGPNEIVEDETDESTSIVLAEKEVVLALSLPRRLLWGLPKQKQLRASIDNRVSGSFRVIPSQLLCACSGTYTLPVQRSVLRAYQLTKDTLSGSEGEHELTVDDDLAFARFKRITLSASHEQVTSDSMNASFIGQLTESSMEYKHSIEQVRSSSLISEKGKKLKMENPQTIAEYHAFMQSIRESQQVQPSTVLLYHYTNPVLIDSILQSGLRMSTQGQGDGGVYFSLLGPASYGFGSSPNTKKEQINHGKDYESRLIIDCYGEERLSEYYGKDLLSCVLVCAVEEGLLSSAPGGRDNALMVPKEIFETLYYLKTDGYYYLPASCIRGVFNLKSSLAPQSETEMQREVEKIQKLEIEYDEVSREKAKAAMKKLIKLSGNNILAVLPSTVPELPGSLITRGDILDILKSRLIPEDHLSVTCTKDNTSNSYEYASSAKTCVLVGMGGMGKSTIVASFAHDTEVRSSFDKIAWISLGQSPDLHVLQESVHLQLTGEAIPHSISLLPPSIVPQQRKEALKLAASSYNVLLILDDVWATSHEAEFNILDANTASVRLISSRIRGLMKQQQCFSEVEVSSLSFKDALNLLVSKSGLNLALLSNEVGSQSMGESNKEYALVCEVVTLTKCLPLTISIAAGLIEQNGSEITQDLVDIMKEDRLRSSTTYAYDSLSEEQDLTSTSQDYHSSLEDRLITASLSMFKGESNHLAMACFLCLAGFAEDCLIPAPLIEALAPFLMKTAEQRGNCLLEASAKLPSMSLLNKKSTIEVRKMMTSLVKVNLISGSFAEPFEFNVHDLIRDYAMSLASIEFLKFLHSQIVLELLHRLNDILSAQHSSSESNDTKTLMNRKLLAYVEGHLHVHMRCVVFDRYTPPASNNDSFEDMLNEEVMKNVTIPNEWLKYIRSKTFQSAFARALSLKGIELLAQKFFNQGDKLKAAKIYFLSSSLLSNRVITHKQNEPLLEKASAIFNMLEEDEIKGDKVIEPQSLCVQLEVINKHLTACTDIKLSHELEKRVSRVVSKYIRNKEYYLNANKQASLFLIDSEDNHMEFLVLYSQVTQVRSDMLRADIDGLKYLHEFRKCYALLIETAKMAPNESLRNLFKNITPLNTLCFLISALSFDEDFTAEFSHCLDELKQGIEAYDYDICGHILKEFGKGVDHFLQGHFSLYIMMHQDTELLGIYCDKVTEAFRVAYERGLKSYHFIWIEVVGAVCYTAQALIELGLFEKALKLLNTIGFESPDTFERDYERYWNHPSRNVSDAVKLSTKYSIFLVLILCHNSNQFKCVSSSANDGSPVLIKEVMELTYAVGRFKDAGYSTLGALGVKVLCLYEMYEEALKLGSYLLETPDVTIKPTARSSIHRCLAHLFFSVKQDRIKADYHFKQSTIEGNKSCFRKVIHRLTKEDKDTLFGSS